MVSEDPFGLMPTDDPYNVMGLIAENIERCLRRREEWSAGQAFRNAIALSELSEGFAEAWARQQWALGTEQARKGAEMDGGTRAIPATKQAEGMRARGTCALEHVGESFNALDTIEACLGINEDGGKPERPPYPEGGLLLMLETLKQSGLEIRRRLERIVEVL